MARAIAFANQKGGVAKTTTALSIAAALAEMERRVLAVDMDPQGALTYSMGVDPETRSTTPPHCPPMASPWTKRSTTRSTGAATPMTA